MEKKTIIIENNEYDITHFNHPGGSVINYMTKGQDATQAFNEFHYRSKKAKTFLQSLPKVSIASHKIEDKEMLEDFAKFRNSLIERGFFKSNYLHVFYRLFEIFAMYLLSAYVIQYNIFASILLFGLVGGRAGWVQHEGGHTSLTGNIKIDKQIQNLFFGFFLLGDGSMWNNMHNKHHATPQKIGHDIDLDTAPLVAFHDRAIEKNKQTAFTKLWLKYQMYTFLPITSGLLVMSFWNFYLHPRKVIRDKNIVQALLILSGHATRILLFMRLASIDVFCAILYHFIAIWITGIYLFGQFSLSHTFTPTIDKNENPNWVRYAIEHTVDISPKNKLVGWIMGYLNNQVVHHLFPSMPQYRGPEVSEELMLFCKKWYIKYTIMNYYEAWYHTLNNLNKVGNEIH
jgi:fatty acid desaturase 2 (delta-6 desaturase)